ncbi:MAG: sigma-70 family RNA polymerase sigma factor [Cyanobacteria bacterium]|nr:sigma-70 family RNA polymerase sigma factor [Cyanobacteriota bacterium]
MARTPSQADALFQQFLPLAESIARTLAAGSRVIELEDARQVAQMQLWLSCRQVTDPASAAGYLRRCIRGALLHHLRDHGRLVRVSRREHEKGIHPWQHSSLNVTEPGQFTAAIDLIESPGSAPEAEGPSSAELEALLDRLPANQAAVIRLHVLQGVPFRQVSAQLGISAQSACRWEKAGLATLRAQVAKFGVQIQLPDFRPIFGELRSERSRASIVHGRPVASPDGRCAVRGRSPGLTHGNHDRQSTAQALRSPARSGLFGPTHGAW